MKFLLDTHVLLWAAMQGANLSQKARTLIADLDNVALVSGASAWEIATKVRLGRMPEALERDFVMRVQQAGYVIREVTASDFLRAGRLVGEHGDPFDRVIAAQALADDIAVISMDTKLDQFGVRRIW